MRSTASPICWCDWTVTSSGTSGSWRRLNVEHLLDRRRGRLPLEEAVLHEPVVVEDLGEIPATRVRDERDERRVRPEALRDLEHRPHRRSARAADEQPLLAREPPGSPERVAVRDRDVLVHERRVVGGRPEVLADALHEIGVDVVRLREDRALRVGAHDEEVGLVLPEEACGARDRAAGADREHDRVELAAGRLPDLGPRRLVVRLRVRLVGVLVRLERARDLLGQAVGDRVVALRRLGRHGGRADDDLGAVAAQQRALLLGDLVRHHEDAAVALDGRGDREAHAGVPARRLDDRPARAQLPLALGRLDHADPDAVLHAPARVHVLELGEQRRAELAPDALEAHERRVPDEVEDGRIVACHRRSVVRRRRDQRPTPTRRKNQTALVYQTAISVAKRRPPAVGAPSRGTGAGGRRGPWRRRPRRRRSPAANGRGRGRRRSGTRA